MTKRLDGKIALVTGASRGIGYATSLLLAKEGAHVVAVARTQGGLEELDDAIAKVGGSATLVPLDLKDGVGVDRLGLSLFERYQKLDVLVGNAGILGKLTPIPHLDPKDWDEALLVNATVNYRLIRAMDPLLRASDHGRAVFVTSGRARSCLPYWGPYGISKATMEALVKTYAAEVATTNIKANLFSPGGTRTKMRATAMPGEDPMTLPSAEDVSIQMVQMCLPSFTDNGGLWKYAGTGLEKQG